MFDKNTVELLFYVLLFSDCSMEMKKVCAIMAWAALLSIHKYIDFDFIKDPQGNSAKIFQRQCFAILQKTTKLTG